MAELTPSQPLRAIAGYYLNLSNLPAPGRAYVMSGPTTVTTPSSGGEIEGFSVDVDGTRRGIAAHRGRLATVRAGGSVSAGSDLQVQGDGDFVTASGGTVVARALESASGGSFFDVVLV